MDKVSSRPTPMRSIAATTCVGLVVATSLMAVITSSGLRPAAAAGAPAETERITGPRGPAANHPDHGMAGSACLTSCWAMLRARLIGIAKPSPAPGPERTRVLMPITLPLRIEQRTTGVAGVDRCIGLDQIKRFPEIPSWAIAVGVADDAHRHGVFQSEGLPTAIAQSQPSTDRNPLGQRWARDPCPPAAPRPDL